MMWKTHSFDLGDFTNSLQRIGVPHGFLVCNKMISLNTLHMYVVKLNICFINVVNIQSKMGLQASQPACEQASKQFLPAGVWRAALRTMSSIAW
jgi:hypothetical protein